MSVGVETRCEIIQRNLDYLLALSFKSQACSQLVPGALSKQVATHAVTALTVCRGQADALPNVSTMGSFFTITLFLAILKTPRTSVTVTTIGRPSGMAATARLGFSKEKQDFPLQCVQPALCCTRHLTACCKSMFLHRTRWERCLKR